MATAIYRCHPMVLQFAVLLVLCLGAVLICEVLMHVCDVNLLS